MNNYYQQKLSLIISERKHCNIPLALSRYLTSDYVLVVYVLSKYQDLLRFTHLLEIFGQKECTITWYILHKMLS